MAASTFTHDDIGKPWDHHCQSIMSFSFSFSLSFPRRVGTTARALITPRGWPHRATGGAGLVDTSTSVKSPSSPPLPSSPRRLREGNAIYIGRQTHRYSSRTTDAYKPVVPRRCGKRSHHFAHTREAIILLVNLVFVVKNDSYVYSRLVYVSYYIFAQYCNKEEEY